MSTVKGFGDELVKLGQAKAAPFIALEEYGMQIAHNAAIERATIEGVQAGQKPGQQMLPAITDADKAFVEAYKKEEYATVTRQAETFLNNIFNEAYRDPNQKTLQSFEKAAGNEFESLIELVSEENRPQLKRNLMGAYENKYFQLINKMQHKNEALLKNNFKLNLDNAVSQIQDYQANYQPDKAKQALNDNIDYIRSLVGTPAIDSKDKADAYIKSLQKTYDAGKVQAELQEAIEEGRGAEFLAERASLPQTPENQEINKALLKQYQNHNRLVGFQSNLSKMQALSEAESGTLTSTRIAELKEKMSEKDKADFDLKLSKINGKNVKNAQDIDFVLSNKENEIKLANVSGDALNAAFGQEVQDFINLLGREPSMQDLAHLAVDYKAPIPQFNNQLKVMITSSDPETAIQGSNIYSSLYSKNPRAVDKIPDNVATKADMVANRIKAGADPNDAVNIANNTIFGVDSRGIEERKERYKQDVLKKYNTPTLQLKLAATDMDISTSNVPDGFVTDYMKNLEDGFTITNNLEDAKQYTKKNMNRVWRNTDINGEPQMMWMPPEATLPFGGDTQYVKKLLTSKVKHLMENQKAQDNPFSLFMMLKNKNKVLGNEVESENGLEKSLYIMSDKYTDLPAPGEYPSYGVYVKTDSAIPKPLQDENHSNVRFVVTEEDVAEYNNSKMKRAQAMNNNIRQYEQVQAKITTALNKYEKE